MKNAVNIFRCSLRIRYLGLLKIAWTWKMHVNGLKKAWRHSFKFHRKRTTKLKLKKASKGFHTIRKVVSEITLEKIDWKRLEIGMKNTRHFINKSKEYTSSLYFKVSISNLRHSLRLDVLKNLLHKSKLKSPKKDIRKAWERLEKGLKQLTKEVC